MLTKLYQLFVEGLVTKQEHPRLPLIIWNYTDKVQYKNLWGQDKFLINCRGLITDTRGNLIAKSFPKFFNYEELETKDIPWNDKSIIIQEKIDGSLGILFNYNREWILSTKGSFDSEQSLEGFEIIKNQCNLSKFDPSFTYLVEIVYPENKIVVSYEKSFVTFLSIFYKDEELDWNESKILLKIFGVDDENIVETKSFASLNEQIIRKLKNENIKNKEGYVVRFLPTNFRFKLKFEEYVRLHKIYSSISNISIWEFLSQGKSFDELIHGVPDEFYSEIENVKNDLSSQYSSLEYDYKCIFEVIENSVKGGDRKEFAVLAKKYKHPSILFHMKDNKDYSKIIWKIIRPEYSKI